MAAFLAACALSMVNVRAMLASSMVILFLLVSVIVSGSVVLDAAKLVAEGILVNERLTVIEDRTLARRADAAVLVGLDVGVLATHDLILFCPLSADVQWWPYACHWTALHPPRRA